MFIVGLIAGLVAAGFILFAGGLVIKKKEKKVSIGGVTITKKPVEDPIVEKPSDELDKTE